MVSFWTPHCRPHVFKLLSQTPERANILYQVLVPYAYLEQADGRWFIVEVCQSQACLSSIVSISYLQHGALAALEDQFLLYYGAVRMHSSCALFYYVKVGS